VTLQAKRFGVIVVGGGGGLGVCGVTPRTLDRPKESVAVGEAAGRGPLLRDARVQWAGVGMDATTGEALEALASCAPPRGFGGVAWPVADVVKHGRRKGAPGLTGEAAGAAVAGACDAGSAASS
jgi:hypothetical protein